MLGSHHEDMDRSALESAYSSWIEQVKAKVPPEQLLVFNVKQGWKPLCDFLQVPDAQCPQGALPHTNTSTEMKRLVFALELAANQWHLGLFVLFWVLFWLVRRCCCGGGGGGKASSQKAKKN